MNKLQNPIRLNTRGSIRVFGYQPDYKLRKKRRYPNFQLLQTEIINGYEVNRLLRWYEKEGDTIVGEIILKGFSITELQNILDEPADSPIFFSYELTSEQVKYFQNKLNQTFNVNDYEYFLECDAI
jgi:hypothetical protein